MSDKLISLIVGFAGCLLVLAFAYGVLFSEPRFAEHFVSGLAGLATWFAARPVIESWLASRRNRNQVDQ